MENILPLILPEILFGSTNSVQSRKLSRLLSEGKIRKISARVYSTNFIDTSETIVRRNLFTIIGKLYPGALLSHRSALEFQPTSSGLLFVTYTYTKKVKLPGVTIQFLQGPVPMDGDKLFVGNLHVSQQARAFLENLQTSRKKGSESKCVDLSVLEEKLEQIIRVYGEVEINKIRDIARSIAVELHFEKEFERFNQIISALLSTQTSKILTSPIARARAFGLAYDPARIELFEKLFRVLKQSEFNDRIEKNKSKISFSNFAFFESYFSNFIEGTVFEINEAIEIIRSNRPLMTRNEDSHDVLGTYHLVSHKTEMEVVPKSADELLRILSYRHAILMSSRTDKMPGVFKDRNNFAGSTSFVDFNLVRGTLLKSFDFYQILDHPFSKAAYLMFVISEVHPFLDGNGRIARVMMNAELVHAGQSKIIIPTVYRDDYMGALKKLTRQGNPETYIKMLQRAHEFSANVFDEELQSMQHYLESCYAFSDESDVILKIVPRYV